MAKKRKPRERLVDVHSITAAQLYKLSQMPIGKAQRHLTSSMLFATLYGPLKPEKRYSWKLNATTQNWEMLK